MDASNCDEHCVAMEKKRLITYEKDTEVRLIRGSIGA